MAERVQVQGLGEAPTVQPVALPGFQYGIAQRRAGRNKLMDLADALSQVNPILQQYGALQQTQERIGAEQAELIEEQNVIAELKKTKDIGGFSPLARYNRDRAYRDVLLKRAVNNNLIPQLEADTDDLLNLDSFKTRQDFESNLEEYMNKQWSSFSSEVGETAASSTAAKALWSTVSIPYKNKLSLAYEANKQKAVELGLQDELAFTLSNVTRDKGFDTSVLADVASNFETILADSGVDKGQRNRLIVDGYAAAIDKLYAKRRYSDAKRVLDSIGTIRINGKPVFGTKEADKQLIPLLSKVNTKLNEVGTSSTTEARSVLKGKILSVLRTPAKSMEDMPEYKMNILKGIFSTLDPDLEQEEIKGYVEQVFQEGDMGDNLLNTLNRVASEGDLAESLYFRINSDVLAEYKEIKELRDLTPRPITDDTIPVILDEFRSYQADNDEEVDPWKGFLSANPRIKKFDELLDESKRLSAGNYVLKKDYYTSISTSIRENLKAVEQQGTLKGATPEITSGVYLPSSISYIKKEVKKEAFKLAGEDPDVRDAKLELLTNQLIQEERQRFEGIAVASTIEFDKTKEVPLRGAAQTAMEETYPSMRSLEERLKIPFLRKQVEEDRVKMVSNTQIPELKLSLIRYGFNQWNPKNIELLEKAELDATDLRLFANFNQFSSISGDWLDIINKDELREKLTEDEKEQRKIYNQLGIFDEPTWQFYFNAQKTYY
jgi:hypothetical protein